MMSAYLACTTRRLSFSVGVSSSLSAVHSTGSSRQYLTCWTRASRCVGGRHGLADRLQHGRVRGQLGQRARLDAPGPGPGRRHLAVQGQHRDHVRTPVAVGERLADQRVGDQQVLDPRPGPCSRRRR